MPPTAVYELTTPACRRHNVSVRRLLHYPLLVSVLHLLTTCRPLFSVRRGRRVTPVVRSLPMRPGKPARGAPGLETGGLPGLPPPRFRAQSVKIYTYYVSSTR